MHVLHLDVTKDEHVAAAKEFVGMQNTDKGKRNFAERMARGKAKFTLLEYKAKIKLGTTYLNH